MKRIRDTFEFAAGWLTLKPGERIVVAREIHCRRSQRVWNLEYVTPFAWLVG